MLTDDYAWHCPREPSDEEYLQCEAWGLQRVCDFRFLMRRTEHKLLFKLDEGTDLPIMIRQYNERWNDNWSQKHLEIAAANIISTVVRSLQKPTATVLAIMPPGVAAGTVCPPTSVAGTPATMAASAVTWHSSGDQNDGSADD